MAKPRSNERVDAILDEWFGCARVPRDATLLSEAEELELVRRAQDGDDDARDRLVVMHMRLAASIAMRYRGMGVDFDDLLTEGAIGLVVAVRRYEAWRGVRFGSYAGLPIRQFMSKAVAERGRAVRVPLAVQRMRRGWLATGRSLAVTLGRAPTDAEVDAASGLSPKHLAKVRASGAASAPMVRTSGPRPDRAFDPLASLPDDATGAPEAMARADDFREAFARLDDLPLKEAEVLRLHAGLEGEPLTDRAIAERLGVTCQCVQSRRHSALARLRGDKPPQTWSRRAIERGRAGLPPAPRNMASIRAGG